MSLINDTFADQVPEWIGSATELKKKLLANGGEKYLTDKLEAMGASEVGKRLSEISKNLNRQGWDIQQKPRSGKDGRKWSIRSPNLTQEA